MTALRLNQPQKTDSSCQTGTHILYDGHSHIDNAYHWNEWDLRRQAILLVNLKKKLTHSTQTDVSHFRKEVSVQCYRHGKQTGTQTRRDGATTMPKRVNFIKGLRGHPEVKNGATVVDLTLDM